NQPLKSAHHRRFGPSPSWLTASAGPGGGAQLERSRLRRGTIRPARLSICPTVLAAGQSISPSPAHCRRSDASSLRGPQVGWSALSASTRRSIHSTTWLGCARGARLSSAIPADPYSL